MVVEATKRTPEGIVEGYVRRTVKTDEYERSVAGTVFSDGRPRIIQVRDINMDFELTPHMLFVRNTDRPGFIGRVGTVMGDAGVNIGTFNLGREKAGGDAICMLSLDDAVSDEILAKVTAIPNVVRVRRLRF